MEVINVFLPRFAKKMVKLRQAPNVGAGQIWIIKIDAITKNVKNLLQVDGVVLQL